MQTTPIDWHIAIAPSEKKQQKHILQPLSPQELSKLAQWLNVEQVRDLEANFSLTRKNSSQAILKGTITALIDQLCIRSLMPTEEKIQIEILYHLTKEEEALEHEKEIPEDDIEYWDGKNLDLGKIVSEELLLHIPPYPKITDEPLAGIEQIETSAYVTKKPQSNPFEVLKKLQYKSKNK